MLVASRRRYQSVGVNVYNILSVTMHERVRLFPHQYERISSFFSAVLDFYSKIRKLLLYLCKTRFRIDTRSVAWELTRGTAHSLLAL